MTHTPTKTSQNALGREQTGSEGKASGRGANASPRANVSNLGGVFDGQADAVCIPPAFHEQLVRYSHIVTRIQQTNFSLWRARRIVQIQQFLDYLRQCEQRHER